MTKHIVLCADDYAQAPAISSGILALLELGRLSATSCMVNMPHWTEHAAWLRPYQSKADIGLHFNLTHGEPLSSEFKNKYGAQFSSLSMLLARSMLRQLDVKIIAAECRAQIQAFKDALGVLPDFIDGHQHIHQFPVIRDAVVQIYNEQLKDKKAYVRLVNPKILSRDYIQNIKKLIIVVSGANALQKLLMQYHIPHNTSFAGIYAFNQAAQYPMHFRRFLQEIQDGGLIMCHPGLASTAEHDPIYISRPLEYKYLASKEFAEDCNAANVSYIV